MKKTLKIAGIVLLALMLILAAIPFLFQGKIKEGIDGAIADAIAADVNYENFDLSLLSSFPNLGISVDQLSVVGQDLFLGDTLVYTQQAKVKVNLWSALFGEQMVINRVSLDQPKILIKILDDGTANYDLSTSTDTVNTDSEYAFKINKWDITQGAFTYEDQQSTFFVDLAQVEHTGSGDFNQDIFDLTTKSEALLKDLSYDGVSYLSNKNLIGDIILNINLPESRYTFKENTVSLNEFDFGFDGWLSLEENDDIDMDLKVAAKQNDFQSLLSLVPGMYTEEFQQIETSGQVAFQGNAKGLYNDQRYPEFVLLFQVEDGRFKYPDLPQPVENINMDLTLSNQTGNLQETAVSLPTFHMDMGDNPIDGSLSLNGLGPSEVEAKIDAHLNLAEITQMVPLEGSQIRGQLDVVLDSQGSYDTLQSKFPNTKALMTLKDGYVKSDQFPETLSDFSFSSQITNENGSMANTLIEIPQFNFIMDEEPFSGNLTLSNLENYHWDMAVNGSLDLEKLIHLFPQPGMEVKGVVSGSIQSKGKMSDLEAEQYQLLPTSGQVQVQNLSYKDEDLAHAFNIKTGSAQFDPENVTIQQMDAQTGSSDLQLSGVVTNYINYVFKEDEPIKGTLNLQSNNLDLNEWMTETADSTEAPLEVLEIPKNVDMTINSTLNKVHYDNMTLSNAKGVVNVSNGVAAMRDVDFNALGGTFKLDGNYDSRDLKHPKFDFVMGMAQVDVKQAFNTFNTVKVLAPIAKLVDGDFNSSFRLNGELGQDMMPLLNTLSGTGLVELLEAALAGVDSKIVAGLNNLTKFSNTASNFNLKDLIMQFEIKDGKLNLKPFDLNFGDYATRVSGSTGIDGSILFLLNMEVPAGVVGSSVNQAIAKLTGSDEPTDDMVKLNINMGGTYDNPTFALGGREGGATTASMAKDAVDQKVEEAKDSARTVADEQAEELKTKGRAQLDSLINDQVKDSASNQILQNVKDQIIKDKSVDDVLNIFKKKKKTTDSTSQKPAGAN